LKKRLTKSCQKPSAHAKDEKTAFKKYTEAAKLNNAEAYYALGHCYQNAIGTKKDDKEAVKQYKEAAELNNIEAQYALAECYLYAIGTKQDAKKAANYIEKALKQQPNNTTFIDTYGQTLAAQGKMDKALEEYQRVIATDPQFYTNTESTLKATLKKAGKITE